MARARFVASASSALMCLVAAITPVAAQFGGPVPVANTGESNQPAAAIEPGEALTRGVEFFRRGDLEQAAYWLGQADAKAVALSPSQKNTLRDYSSRTRSSLQARQRASMELQQAESALASGDLDRANEMLRRVQSNNSASAADLERAATLAEQAAKKESSGLGRIFSRSNSSPAGTTAAPVSPASEPATLISGQGPGPDAPVKYQDARRMLNEGRQFLHHHQYDRAETWARSAMKYEGNWGLVGDNPERLLRDIEKARQKNGVAARPPQAAQPPMAADPAQAQRAAALQLLQQSRQALEAGAIPQAEALAVQARNVGAAFGNFEDSPERVLRDIQALKARQQQVPAMAANAAPAAAPGYGTSQPAAPANNPETARMQAQHALNQADQAIAQGQLDRAEQLIVMAERLGQQQYAVTDRRPEQMRAKVQAERQRQSRPQAPAGVGGSVLAARQDAVKKQQAADMLRQAREAITRGNFRQAEQLVAAAEQVGVTFHGNEDSPAKVRDALRAVGDREMSRQNGTVHNDLEKARALMAQARTKMASGNYQGARELVEQARTMGAAFSLYEQRPEDLLRELDQYQRMAAAKPVSYTTGEPAAPAPMVGQSFSVPAPVPVALPQNAGAQAGQRLMSQADNLAAQGNYAEARRTLQHAESGPYAVKEQAAHQFSAVASAETTRDLFESGVKAYERGDNQTARAYLTEVAKNSSALSPLQQQRLQDLLTSIPAATMPSGTAGAPNAPRAGEAKLAYFQPGAAEAGADQDPLQGAIAQEKILLQQLRQRVITALGDANAVFQSNPENAIQQLEDTLALVQESPLDRSRTAPLIRQLEQQIRIYQNRKQAVILDNDRIARNVASMTERRRRQQAEIQKQETIKELMSRYQTLMDQGDYYEAEAIALQITEIDPDEVVGHAALYKAQLARNYATTEDIERRKEKGWYDAMLAVEKSAIPIPDDQPITYIDPREWEELSIRRKKWARVDLSTKSPATERIEAALDRPISFDFNETPLKDVVEFIRDYTGVNVVLDPNALDILSLDPETPITLSIEQISLRSALRLLLDPLEMTYLIKDEVLKITDQQETANEFITRVYPVADLVTPIIDFAGQGGAIGGQGGGGGGLGGGGLGGGGLGGGGGGFGGGGGGGGFGGGGGGFGGGGGGGQQGGFGGGGGQGGLGGGQGGLGGAQYVEEIIELIQNTIAVDQWQDNGGEGSIEYFQPNRSFVVYATQQTHEELADLLTQLRRLQDLQVSVEVRIITLSEQFFERIGVDFDVSIDNNNDDYIRNTLANQNSPLGTNLVDGVGVGVNDGNHVRGTTIGLQPGSNAGRGTNARTANFNVPILQSSFAAATVPGIIQGLDTTLGGTGFGIAFLNDIDVFLVLEAVQGDVRSNIMQAPKVTLFNGQTSTVIVADQVPFITDATPVVSAGAVSFDPTIETFLDGTFLSVQAIVSADRRYVRLQVIPSLQTVTPQNMAQTVPLTGTAGGGGGGGIVPVLPGTATINIQLPIVSITQVLTTVTVPDGGTVLLGGLKSHSEARNEFGTPVLSKIPYVNRLFRNSATARVTNSTMLMVTPRIIILEEEEEKLGVETRPNF